jgi:hypothetical protein
MSWHGALSKRQSRDFFRSYIKPATDFETNPSLSGIQKNKRIPIEQFLYGGRGNAGPPREVDAAPMVDSTTTNSRTRRSEALVRSARAPARSISIRTRRDSRSPFTMREQCRRLQPADSPGVSSTRASAQVPREPVPALPVTRHMYRLS